MATLPTYTAPTYQDLGTYTAPTWDEEEIDTLTQKRAAPGLRAARQAMAAASGVNYENPNVKRMTLRDALQGYGNTVESTLASAGETAESEYGTQYGFDVTNAQAAYTAQANAANAANTLAQNTAQTQYSGALTGYETQSTAEAASALAATNTAAAATAAEVDAEAAQTAIDAAWEQFLKEQEWAEQEETEEAAKTAPTPYVFPGVSRA